MGLAAAWAIPQTSVAAPPEKMDCHGGVATIAGDHRSVEVANCAVVRIEGSHNDVSGRLTKRSKVFVTGDDNTVRLHPKEGLSFGRLKDTGKGNRIDSAEGGPPGPS
jgi:hypothetical protein